MSDSMKTAEGERTAKTETRFLFDVDNTQATTPPFTGSGDTLHDNEAWDAYSNRDDAVTLGGSVSPESLNLNSLTIADEHPRSRQSNGERFNHPFQRGLKQLGDTRSYSPSARSYLGHHRQGASYSGRGGSAGFRNSNTWLSPEAQMQQDFLIVRNSMRRLFKNSDVAKWKLSDYIAHREAMTTSQENKLARQAKSEEGPQDSSLVISQEVDAFLRRCGLNGNFQEVGNFGRALGEQTIWCKDWENGKDEIAPWPSFSEMRWEGDDRAKTGVGRFLPLPREEGPPGLMWSQLPTIEQYPMDQVCKIPTMEDVYLPVDYDIEPDHEYLWSKELEQDMDALLDS
jgi:hypothetical protein